MTAANTLQAAFADAPLESAANFRTILQAMSRPGRIYPAAHRLETPEPMSATSASIVLTLVDYDTPLWLSENFQNDAMRTYLAFHCGCPIVDTPCDAIFALIDSKDVLPSFTEFSQGTPEFPDRSTTLILQVDSLMSEQGVKLTGPGIQSEHMLNALPLDKNFWQQAATNNQQFPLGVDFIFSSPDAIAACPRSTHIDYSEMA